MKNRVSVLFVVMAFVLIVSLACGGSTSSTTQAPVQPQSQPANTQDTTQSQSGPSSDYKIFVDKNNLVQFEIPGDWKHTTGDVEGGYVDSFKSPDDNALIENFVYDGDVSFTGGSNGKAALYLLHKYYSATGQEGDIKITDDAVQKDGSERLVWTSRSGGFSGVSFFEVRQGTTFIMLTGKWVNDYENTYLDIVNHTIETYKIP